MNCWVQIDEEKVAKFKFTDDAVDYAERMDRNPRFKGAVQAFWFGEFCEKPQRIYPEKVYPGPDAAIKQESKGGDKIKGGGKNGD